MTYIHDTVIREYLSGKVIQRRNSHVINALWKDIPVYGSEDSIPMFVSSIEYRVKPEVKYCFFHTDGELVSQGMKTMNNILFEFPKYEPSGPHIMIKFIEDEIIETYHSNTASTGYLDEPKC